MPNHLQPLLGLSGSHGEERRGSTAFVFRPWRVLHQKSNLQTVIAQHTRSRHPWLPYQQQRQTSDSVHWLFLWWSDNVSMVTPPHQPFNKDWIKTFSWQGQLWSCPTAFVNINRRDLFLLKVVVTDFRRLPLHFHEVNTLLKKGVDNDKK